MAIPEIRLPGKFLVRVFDIPSMIYECLLPNDLGPLHESMRKRFEAEHRRALVHAMREGKLPALTTFRTPVRPETQDRELWGSTVSFDDLKPYLAGLPELLQRTQRDALAGVIYIPSPRG